MKLKLIVVIFVAIFVSGCTVCSSKEGGVSSKTEAMSSDWGSQKHLNMQGNSGLRKGAAHGRVKMTKDRTSEVLSR